jgi:hypothetical protein
MHFFLWEKNMPHMFTDVHCDSEWNLTTSALWIYCLSWRHINNFEKWEKRQQCSEKLCVCVCVCKPFLFVYYKVATFQLTLTQHKITLVLHKSCNIPSQKYSTSLTQILKTCFQRRAWMHSYTDPHHAQLPASQTGPYTIWRPRLEY